LSVCSVKKNAFGRWILTNPCEPSVAWTGTRWAEINADGIGIKFQVSNFVTREEAESYAWDVGFSEITLKPTPTERENLLWHK
jgi:hypothetical protein